MKTFYLKVQKTLKWNSLGKRFYYYLHHKLKGTDDWNQTLFHSLTFSFFQQQATCHMTAPQCSLNSLFKFFLNYSGFIFQMYYKQVPKPVLTSILYTVHKIQITTKQKLRPLKNIFSVAKAMSATMLVCIKRSCSSKICLTTQHLPPSLTMYLQQKTPNKRTNRVQNILLRHKNA